MWGVKQLVIFSVVLLVNLPGCSEAGGGAAGGPVVLMATSQGEVKIELFEKEAPETVKNFLAYVNEGFYDGTIFHRVIPGFMIQGGGFTEDMQQKPVKPAIKNEAANGLTNDTGTLAMARTNMIDSATSQFFVNVNDNDFLNHQDTSMQGFGYCVFGRVIEGVDVVSAIERVQTGRKGLHADVPQEPIIIQSMKVVSEAQYDAQSES
jgi:cyclophilin family peptidyl-prolyl cis-trans isomerase